MLSEKNQILVKIRLNKIWLGSDVLGYVGSILLSDPLAPSVKHCQIVFDNTEKISHFNFTNFLIEYCLNFTETQVQFPIQ